MPNACRHCRRRIASVYRVCRSPFASMRPISSSLACITETSISLAYGALFTNWHRRRRAVYWAYINYAAASLNYQPLILWRVENMSKRAVIIPFVMLGVAAALLFTINGCWTSWEGGKAKQRTDDAYVRADMTPLSTRISGTLRKLDVDDFAPAKPGHLPLQPNHPHYRPTLDHP